MAALLQTAIATAAPNEREPRAKSLAAVRNAIRAVEPVRLRPSPESSLRCARTPDTQDCPKFHLVQIVVVLVACLLEDIALTRRALSRELAQDIARVCGTSCSTKRTIFKAGIGARFCWLGPSRSSLPLWLRPSWVEHQGGPGSIDEGLATLTKLI